MMAQLVDRDSIPASKNELMLFSVPPTQIAVQCSYDRVFYPKNLLAGNGAIRFEIPPNPTFLDVSHNSLYCKFKIVRADNGDMQCDDQAGPPVVPARDFAAQNQLYWQHFLQAAENLCWWQASMGLG